MDPATLTVVGTVLVALITTFPKLISEVRSVRRENAADHAAVQTSLGDLATEITKLSTWTEGHDQRHEDLNSRLEGLEAPSR